MLGVDGDARVGEPGRLLVVHASGSWLATRRRSRRLSRCGGGREGGDLGAAAGSDVEGSLFTCCVVVLLGC